MSTNARSSSSASLQRTGLVLAAGLGSRLAGAADSARLKPLTRVAGVPLVVRTLRSLETAGCASVVMVTGFRAEEMERAVEEAYHGPLDVRFVRNPRYELSNGVSLLAARPLLNGPFVLTMADHVFGDEVMRIAASHRPETGGASLLVDHKLESIFDMDDATKVLESNGRIRSIGKQLAEYNAVDTGLFVCTDGLLDAVAAVFERKGDASLSDGVGRLAAQDLMAAVDIGDGFWQDVDTPEMLAHAAVSLSRMTAPTPGNESQEQ